MLEFAHAPDVDQLVETLGTKLGDYFEWRDRRRPGSQDTTNLTVREVIPCYRIPRGSDLQHLELNDVLQSVGWHVQVHQNRQPAFYARMFFREKWVVDWIGEAWLSEAVHAGIEFLNQRECELPDSKVRLLSSRIYRFSSLWLTAGEGEHLIVHRHPSLHRDLPILEWMPQDELKDSLLESYGPDYAAGGLRT